MTPASTDFTTIDDYIALQPAAIRPLLERVRQVIRAAAPDATERIAYRMPSFDYLGHPLVYFGAFKAHIGFFPPMREAATRGEAARYTNERGNFRFPFDDIPYDLITRIVVARMRANDAHIEQAKAKRAAKRAEQRAPKAAATSSAKTVRKTAAKTATRTRGRA